MASGSEQYAYTNIARSTSASSRGGSIASQNAKASASGNVPF